MKSECKRCGLSSDVRGLQIDESGVCNFCRFYDAEGSRWTNYARGESLLAARFEKVRGRFPYDALVGISGGKDGAYVLYKLAVEKKLKVLAITSDNGFLTNEAREKVGELVAKTCVDHEFIAPPFSDFYRGTLLTMGNPCVACSLGGYYLAFKVCAEKRIPFFVHGRASYQMFRNMTPESRFRDLFVMLSESNYHDHSDATVRECYAKAYGLIEKMVQSFPIEPAARAGIMDYFFQRPENFPCDFMPEAFAYFLAESYDEDLIRKTLRDKIGYEAPSTHSDCRVHNVSNYLSGAMYNSSFRKLEVATQLRWGKISREDAQKEFQADQIDFESNLHTMRSEFLTLSEKVGMKSKGLASALKLPEALVE